MTAYLYFFIQPAGAGSVEAIVNGANAGSTQNTLQVTANIGDNIYYHITPNAEYQFKNLVTPDGSVYTADQLDAYLGFSGKITHDGQTSTYINFEKINTPSTPNKTSNTGILTGIGLLALAMFLMRR